MDAIFWGLKTLTHKQKHRLTKFNLAWNIDCLENQLEVCNSTHLEHFLSLSSTQQIAYTKTGQGQAVVFIHGLGLQKEIWNTVIATLKENFCCIAIDLPGSGRSSYVPDFELDDYATQIHHILQHEKINYVSIIGHSLGGYVALAFGRLFPHQLVSLGLFHSTAFVDNEEKINNRKQIIRVAQEKKDASFFFSTLIQNQFSKQNQTQMQTSIKQWTEASKCISWQALVQYQTAILQRTSGEQWLQTTPMPVLFVYGEHDAFIDKTDIFSQALLCKKPSLYNLKNSAHIGMLEETSQSIDLLNHFLRLV